MVIRKRHAILWCVLLFLLVGLAPISGLPGALANPALAASPEAETKAPDAWSSVPSPDGRWLAYWQWIDGSVATDQRRLGVWMLPAGGEGPTPRATLISHHEASSVSRLAWSPDSQRLAWVIGDRLMVTDIPGEPRVLARIEIQGAVRPDVRWTSDSEAVLCAFIYGGRHALWSIDLASGLHTPIAGPLSVGLEAPLDIAARSTTPMNTPPRAAPALRSVEVGYDWYRYQGEWDSGAMASNNCGPTSVAMAIQYARDNQWVAISDIRNYIGGSGWTYPSMLQSALNHWQVPNQRLYAMPEIREALIDRQSIVLVHLWMYWITPGSDYLVSYSDPSSHYGRFYSYDQSHWVVLKGISEDGQWFICHDPNVWDTRSTDWYSGSIPKGRDRYYDYGQIASSIADYGYEAVEVFASTPSTATPTASPTSSPSPTSTSTMTPTPSPTLTGTGSATVSPTPTETGSASVSATPTSTGSASPTHTATSVVTVETIPPDPTDPPVTVAAPTATPRPAVELLQNGGFETGEAWTFPSTPATGLRSQAQFHSGAWSAFLGLRPEQQDVYSYSTVHQRFLVPSDAEKVTISFWYRAGTEETSSAQSSVRWDGYRPLAPASGAPQRSDAMLWSSYDWQRALILDASYTLRETLWTTCETTDAWRYVQVDLVGYAGEEAVLFFEVLNNGAGGRTTYMYVDDVSVQIPGSPRVWLPLVLS